MTRLAAMIVSVGMALLPLTSAHADGHPTSPVVGSVGTAPQPASHVDATLQALAKLHSYGYVINTTTRAERAIRAWQRANGLVVDGVVGPQVLASLDLPAAPVAGKTALAPAVRQTQPVPAAEPTDDPCAEMSAYRQAAGLPEQFDAIGYRESRCHNEVGNACCHGYWANYLSSHLSPRSAYRDRIINECGVTQVADIRGTSDAQKRASACVTFVVWSISGMSPWAL